MDRDRYQTHRVEEAKKLDTMIGARLRVGPVAKREAHLSPNYRLVDWTTPRTVTSRPAQHNRLAINRETLGLDQLGGSPAAASRKVHSYALRL
jgi:hypothetical protein